MKAIVVRNNGSSVVLQYETVETPRRTDTKVLVKTTYAGVNFIDIYHRSGVYPQSLPFIPGLEASGVVEMSADGSAFKAGDRVAYWSTMGSYAEYALVEEAQLVPIPNNISSEIAAAALLQGLTAHYLADETFPLAQRHVALVYAAAGGVGRLLTQRATQRGATVIGVVSSVKKAEIAKQSGAQHIIRYDERAISEAVLHITDGVGVDVVYDSVGLATFQESIASLAKRGMFVSYGQSSGMLEPTPPSVFAKKSLFFTRPTLFDYIDTHEKQMHAAKVLFDTIAAQRMDILVDKIIPLADAHNAHQLLEQRKTVGKILLAPQ